jgi:hypothetical protein
MNAMAKPMFPGAAGYGAAYTVGDNLRARQAAQGQARKSSVLAAKMAEPAGTGYGSLLTKGQVNAQAQIRSGSHTRPATRSVTARPNPGSAKQYARKAPMPAGAGNSPVSQVVKQADDAGKKGLLKGKGKGLAIGAGAAVIAGLAYSGRRGEGSSGGRTGMTRY